MLRGIAMATFVLIAGGYCGGWSWNRVAPQLRAAGHEVWTPTLTGLGDRVHLATPEVDLATHTTANLAMKWLTPVGSTAGRMSVERSAARRQANASRHASPRHA